MNTFSFHLSVKFFIIILIYFITPSSVLAAKCREAYDNARYEIAINLCLKEKDYDAVARSYGALKDCGNLQKYYRLVGKPYALGNIGINLLGGYRGCEKDTFTGVRILEEDVIESRKAYAHFLGKHYLQDGQLARAKKYFRLALDQTQIMEWDRDRARDALNELLKLYDADEKKILYLEKIHIPQNATDWEDELASKSLIDLQEILNTTEKIDFVLSNRRATSELKCKFGRRLYQNDFRELIMKLNQQNNTNAFVKLLCKGDKEFFLAKTYENGLGNVEDFQEAYRLYLLAGANGNLAAKDARDRVRDKLSQEQIKFASCLANFGMEPSYLNKLRCKF
jgi:hypothetical protein